MAMALILMTTRRSPTSPTPINTRHGEAQGEPYGSGTASPAALLVLVVWPHALHRDVIGGPKWTCRTPGLRRPTYELRYLRMSYVGAMPRHARATTCAPRSWVPLQAYPKASCRLTQGHNAYATHCELMGHAPDVKPTVAHIADDLTRDHLAPPRTEFWGKTNARDRES